MVGDELVGELKVPFNTMDALAAYYLSTRTSDREGLYRTIQKYLREQPAAKDIHHIRYGPISMK